MRCFSPSIRAYALALFIFGPAVRADWIPTNVGNGADAEVRDHQPTTNFGASTELATRIVNNFPAGASDGNDRCSAMYTRFDLAGQTIPANFTAAFRLTLRNSNFTPNRLHDSATPNLSHRTGLAIYGLNPTNAGANWSEATITYANAPGITTDGNNGTKDLTSSLIPLGTLTFPPAGVQNRLAIGSSVIFRSAALNNFISNAVFNAGVTRVTLVSILLHCGDEPTTDWRNFNYAFNPKEQTTLNTDVGYDADTTNPSNPLGSPHSAASNATGTYSPAIRLDPVPTPSLRMINVESNRVDLKLESTLDGYPFHIERSYGLAPWVRIATVTGAPNGIVFSDERPTGDSRGFYRAAR
jgi:hypothetical protein